MSCGVSTLEATEADLPDVEALLIELINTQDNPQGFSTQRLRENCRLLIKRADSCLLVAKIGETVVGLISFSLRHTATAPEMTGLIDELIVSRDYRGQGIGRRLVSAVVNRCRQLGCCELEVSTEKANANAREFYKRCGFEEDAVLLEMHFDKESC
jgi:ribosomal protein S18 acetylase RimI-like enzyme